MRMYQKKKKRLEVLRCLYQGSCIHLFLIAATTETSVIPCFMSYSGSKPRKLEHIYKANKTFFLAWMLTLDDLGIVAPGPKYHD